MKAIINFIKEVFTKFIDDKAPKLGASLSFYTIFSLAPLLIITISVMGLVFGEEAARQSLVEQISELIGEDGAIVVETALRNSADQTQGIIALIISLVTLAIGSTFVFIELQDSLDMIWKVKPKPGRSMIKGLIRDRIISFSIVIGIGFLLLVSLVISALITALGDYINEHLVSIPPFILQLINLILSFGVIFLLFAMIYRVLPDVHLAWSDVWMGAGVTAALFVIGKFLIGLYLGTSSTASAYGAAGSLVVMLLWIYYSAQILFLGAEFTQVYTNKYGSGIRPKSQFMKYANETAMAEKTDEPEEKGKKSA
jgi:membrane protein